MDEHTNWFGRVLQRFDWSGDHPDIKQDQTDAGGDDRRSKLGCCVLLAITVLVFILFPHAHWFSRVWGIVVGISAIGSLWLIFKRVRAHPERRPSGWATIGWSAALLFIVLLIIELALAEHRLDEFQDIAHADLASMQLAGIELNDELDIERFKDLCAKADLFYPNHEKAQRTFSIILRYENGRIERMKASILERHLDDIAIEFRAMAFENLIVPGGAKFLAEIESR